MAWKTTTLHYGHLGRGGSAKKYEHPFPTGGSIRILRYGNDKPDSKWTIDITNKGGHRIVGRAETVSAAKKRAREEIDKAKTHKNKKVPIKTTLGRKNWDESFIAGWKASKKTKQFMPPNEAWKKKGSKYGSDFARGYGAYIDYKRGAYAQKSVQDAKRLGLIKSTHVGGTESKTTPAQRALIKKLGG